MNDTERHYRYQSGKFVRFSATSGAAWNLEVADSWLVDAGRARALDLHRERFIRSALQQGYPDSRTLEEFWNHALAAIPPVERWFPRVELRSAGDKFQLSLLMRLARHHRQQCSAAMQTTTQEVLLESKAPTPRLNSIRKDAHSHCRRCRYAFRHWRNS
jgi:hypothetical protein